MIEQVEDAKTTHLAAKARVARLRGWLATTTATLDAIAADVQSGRTERLAEVSDLSKDKSDIENELTSALAECEGAEIALHREEQDQAKLDLVNVRSECLEQRDLFLSSYRSACIALGSYLDLRSRACELTTKTATGFGVLPPEMNALRELEFSQPPAETVRDGLMPKIDADWKLSFPITPMHERFRTR
jgi:hypothetical protein